MRIVHLGKFYSPEHGGIEEVTQTLAAGAAHRGHTVTVECFTAGAASSELLDGVGVRRHAAPRVKASQPLSWRYLWTALRAFGQADVVHLHVPNLLAALAAALHWRRGAALVVHWHSDIVAKGWLGLVASPVEWLMLRRADAVIATSAPYIEGSRWLQRFRGKVTVVPIGIHDRFPARGERLHVESAPVVLAVGRLVPYKGFDVLIDAAALLAPGVQIVIAGNGPLKAELQQRIDRLGLRDRVRLAGRVPASELQALYQRAALFCLPSVERSEAFGVVLLEALCAGLPVVATRIEHSGVAWVNEHGVTGLNVPVRDATSLAAACNKLLLDPALRAGYGAAARQRYEALFTIERSLQLTESVYGAAVQQNRP